MCTKTEQEESLTEEQVLNRALLDMLSHRQSELENSLSELRKGLYPDSEDRPSAELVFEAWYHASELEAFLEELVAPIADGVVFPGIDDLESKELERTVQTEE